VLQLEPELPEQTTWCPELLPVPEALPILLQLELPVLEVLPTQLVPEVVPVLAH